MSFSYIMVLASINLTLVTGGTDAKGVENLGPHTDIAVVQKNEGCISLANRIGYQIGRKGCEYWTRTLKLQYSARILPNKRDSVDVEPILQEGESWALVKDNQGKVVFFGPYRLYNKK